MRIAATGFLCGISSIVSSAVVRLSGIEAVLLSCPCHSQAASTGAFGSAVCGGATISGRAAATIGETLVGSRGAALRLSAYPTGAYCVCIGGGNGAPSWALRCVCTTFVSSVSFAAAAKTPCGPPGSDPSTGGRIPAAVGACLGSVDRKEACACIRGTPRESRAQRFVSAACTVEDGLRRVEGQRTRRVGHIPIGITVHANTQGRGIAGSSDGSAAIVCGGARSRI